MAEFLAILDHVEAYVKQRKPAASPPLLALLLSLLFISADKRQLSGIRTLTKTCRQVLLDGRTTSSQRSSFLREQAAIAGQIAQRGWKEEALELTGAICSYLVRQKDFNLIRTSFVGAMMHMQMFCKWEGVAGSLRQYYPWHLLTLCMMRQATREYDKHREDPKKQEGARLAGRFFLRNYRDMITNIARLLMKDESDIYTEMTKAWGEMEKDCPRRAARARLFLQMTAVYWQQTQPSSSRRQWDKMAPVLLPSLLNKGSCIGLLRDMV